MADMVQREPIEWLEIWVEEANEEKQPRILFIGDSIAKSYFDLVSNSLKGKAACAKLATSRFIADPILADELSLLLKQYSFSVIHFNNGLHGMGNPDELYQKHLPTIIELLQSLSPSAKLIWASTTPWRCEGNIRELHLNNSRVLVRNRIAQEYARAHAIPTNELYDLLISHPEYHDQDGVHLLDHGKQAIAEKTAALLLPMLEDTLS